MSHGGRDKGFAPASVAPEQACLGIEEEEAVAPAKLLHIVIRSLETVTDMPQLQVKEPAQASCQAGINLAVNVNLILYPSVPVPLIAGIDVTRVLYPENCSVMVAVIPVQRSTECPLSTGALLNKRPYRPVEEVIEPFPLYDIQFLDNRVRREHVRQTVF